MRFFSPGVRPRTPAPGARVAAAPKSAAARDEDEGRLVAPRTIAPSMIKERRSSAASVPLVRSAASARGREKRLFRVRQH